MTKIQAMRALEAKGLSFTANVIMTGCGKPTAKMTAILKLIEMGCEVRHAQFDICAIVVDGVLVTFGRLDTEFQILLGQIQTEKKGWV